MIFCLLRMLLFLSCSFLIISIFLKKNLFVTFFCKMSANV